MSARPLRGAPPAEPALLRFTVPENQQRERLDSALATLSQVSRAQIRRWIDAGRVTLNGLTPRASQRVTLGDEIEALPPEVVVAEARPERIPLAVLYEDAHLIVVDKPAGMVVHPAPGHPSGTLVNALLHHCGDLAGVGGVLRPGIVHRLDQGTSGVMVAAKNDEAHVALSDQFRDHSIERMYRAFVRGVPRADRGRVDRPVGRHPRDRKRMSVRSRSGREAHTAWCVARRFPRSALSELEVRPETGRTHQIRVHLSSVGLPIVGDPSYGSSGRAASRRRGFGLDRPALHAALLGFRHPQTGAALRLEAPLPADLLTLVKELEAAEARP